jgi:hypothetical protein
MIVGGNRRGVFYVAYATHSDRWHLFSMVPDPSLYNKSLLVARGIRGLELVVQKSQENGNTTAYIGVKQNANLVQLSVGDSHGKSVVEEELEVSRSRLSVWLEDLVTVRLF